MLDWLMSTLCGDEDGAGVLFPATQAAALAAPGGSASSADAAAVAALLGGLVTPGSQVRLRPCSDMQQPCRDALHRLGPPLSFSACIACKGLQQPRVAVDNLHHLL